VSQAPFLFAALVAFASAVSAQQPSGEELIRKTLADNPPVQFVAEPKDSVPTFGSISNVTFKPKGDGPFPAVVIVHTCGGVKDAHVADHVREFLARNYVVLVQDSFGPRGKRDCGINNSQAPISLVGVGDAYAALAHLRNYPFVDKERIFLTGYSWGGMTAQIVPSPGVAQAMKSPYRFKASVANYIGCFNGQGRPFMVAGRIDRPVLMLLAGKDSETPSGPCIPLLQSLAAAGSPVSFHVYDEATHGWDKAGQVRDGYYYDEKIAKDATERAIQFFEAQR
jgi:dienelactone hydrolase